MRARRAMRSTRAPASPLEENSLRAAARIRSRVRFGSRATTRRCELGERIVAMEWSNRIDTNRAGTWRQADVRARGAGLSAGDARGSLAGIMACDPAPA